MNVLVFAGTTEGRKITEYLNHSRHNAYASVATDYGKTLLEDCESVNILCGRMDTSQIVAFMKEKAIDLVIDATHPYAVVATANIKEAAKKASVEYLRCLREAHEQSENSNPEEISKGKEPSGDIILVDSVPDAVEYLKTTEGHIFISTGSKELGEYTKIPDYKERCFARVLSVKESIEKSIALGFEGAHLIALQGPFSMEMNEQMLKNTKASYFVTKESGKAGGFEEKVEAARRTGVKLVVVGRPVEEGCSVEEVCRMLQNQESEADENALGQIPEKVELSQKQTSYVWKNQKQLRTGYTTGSCAQAATKAAAHMLFTGETVREVEIVSPSGVKLYLEIEEIQIDNNSVTCAVRKDSGDDPDITNGVLVYAKVGFDIEKNDSLGTISGKSMDRPETEIWGLKDFPNIRLMAGRGIGTVTKKGLEQYPGEPAINKVPRQVICQAVAEEMKISGRDLKEEISVIIWIPEGEALAKKTFNPRLGIQGGISVLGTSGIVEPMSEKALTDTIYLDMKMKKKQGYDYCYVVPGNYGTDFLKESEGYRDELTVKCSNYVGEVIDDAVRLQMKGILLVGHIGKFVKLAAGIMNTHSKQADGRLEILATHATLAGAEKEVIKKLMQCITTVEALEILEEAGVLEATMNGIMERMEYYLKLRAGENLRIGAVMFENQRGILGKTSDADAIKEEIKWFGL